MIIAAEAAFYNVVDCGDLPPPLVQNVKAIADWQKRVSVDSATVLF